jgi:hypothetical protein
VNAGRLALISTCVVVAGAGTWFAAARWDDANKVATVASALGALAAVGVAVWAAVRSTRQGSSVTATDTGRATAGRGGTAVSGVVSPSDAAGADVRAQRTGDARADGAGTAISGVRLNLSTADDRRAPGTDDHRQPTRPR